MVQVDRGSIVKLECSHDRVWNRMLSSAPTSSPETASSWAFHAHGQARVRQLAAGKHSSIGGASTPGNVGLLIPPQCGLQ